MRNGHVTAEGVGMESGTPDLFSSGVMNNGTADRFNESLAVAISV